MNLKAVLFDLDGTLLPMDQDVFMKAYFKGLTAKLAPHGYESKALFEAVWAGTMAMIRNSGEKSNEAVFWDTFTAICGEKVRRDLPLFDSFYRNEFDAVQSVCGYNPQASETVRVLKRRGVRVALATNPVFPSIATEKRIRWAGLEPEDFELFTTYENSRFCKPNPEYYKEILRQLGLEPEECLMVGNDVGDDMVAKPLGMKVFLLTDCLINKDNTDIALFPHGGFPQLAQFIDSLIA